MDEQLYLLIERYPKLAVCKEDIKKAYELLEEAYRKGRKLLVCGNGGSASDSEHIVGELMKEFKLKRKVYANQAEAMKNAASNPNGSMMGFMGMGFAQQAGGANAQYFENNDAFLAQMKDLIKEGDSVLVKASNGMHFKQIVEALQKL